MSDPLTLLRSFSKAQKPIVDEGEYLVFDDKAVPKEAKTAYQRKKNSDDFYTIGTLWFFLQHSNVPHHEYLQLTSKHNVGRIEFVHRKDLLKYLQDEKATSANVDPTVFTGGSVIPVSDLKGHKRLADEDFDEPKPEKAQKTDEEAKRRETGDAEPALDRGKPAADDAPEIAFIKAMMKRERILCTRNSVLGSNTKSFGSVLEIMNGVNRRRAKNAQKQKEGTGNYNRFERKQDDYMKDRMKDHGDFQIDPYSGLGGDILGKGNAPDASTKNNTGSSVAQPTNTAKPIIIVPNVQTAKITIFNAKQFLQDGQFFTTRQMKENGAKRPDKDTDYIIHRTDDQLLTFRVVDNIKRLSRQDWENVVAVFIAGPEWQFREWPMASIAQIFQMMLGVYVHYNDEKVPEHIKQWNVQTVSVSQSRRHLDQPAVRRFWELMMNFMVMKRPDFLLKS
eukprot:Clim_evm17s51 gene=Clim_evmTU17s51